MNIYWRHCKGVTSAKLRLLRGGFRMFFNACPLCNSDAPELDSCPLCHGYHSANGDPYPPSREILNRWKKEYRQAIRAKIMALRAVRDSRLRRAKSDQ